ncbi:MAG: type II toxin-antitoxin system prevent-host-death family antitoxin [Acidimicrobiales bacterium]
MATHISSREFNQDTAGAKKAAENGPVYITDRGRPAHVLLTYEAYEELIGAHSVLDTLSRPPGIEHVDFEVPTREETPMPAVFD